MPIKGREQVADLQSALLSTIDAFEPKMLLRDNANFVAVFTIKLGNHTIDGMDHMHINEAGLVDSMTVAWRPLPSAIAVQQKLAPKLGGQTMKLVNADYGSPAYRLSWMPERTTSASGSTKIGRSGNGCLMGLMPKMLAELAANPELGLLTARAHLGLRNALSIQYRKSGGHLQAFARSADKTHRPAWTKLYRIVGSHGDVGIWHETDVVPKGNVETIYVNMPRFGLPDDDISKAAVGWSFRECQRT